MTTPICDFVNRYSASDAVRLHMPGHKGVPVLGPEPLDITEIDGADVLYHAGGIILESERNAEKLFGTKRTVYSTEGSSLSIRAMLYLCCLWAAKQGRRPRIAAGRNAHRVFLSTCALLDIDIDWLYPENGSDLVSCEITPAGLERSLSASAEMPTAVYITSPDYLGSIADIRGLSEVCHRHGCLLVVDNAHGSYLKFLPEDRHPITLGADLCCDSAHKTLPALTGAGYLHIAKRAPELFSECAEQAMALFASTSPSYLIMQSLDLCNGFLEKLPPKLAAAEMVWTALKDRLRSSGYTLAGDEPLKLTILPKNRGYQGTELGGLLERQGFVCEFADADHLVLMLPITFPENLPEQICRALASVSPRSPITELPPASEPGTAVYTPHEVLMLPARNILLKEAVGRIMHAPMVSCPPAIPVLVSGERITESAVRTMEYYGIETVTVVDCE